MGDITKKKEKPHYHIDTSNQSFLEMHGILKNMGIKNNKFFLAIYDKDLMHLSYDEIKNPSIEIKAKIIKEIRRNYWYFIREIVRIPVSGGTKPYELHRGNLAMTWSLLRNINVFEILPRQKFKTISAVIFYLWLYLYATKNSEIAFLNKSDSDSKKNLARFNEIKEQLPEWLQLLGKDGDNKKMISHKLTNNIIVTKPSAISEEGAINIGRGATQPFQWYDEFCFLKYNRLIYTSASPAFSQASLEAKRNGKPYHKLITTTTGDLRVPHGAYAKKFIEYSATFDEHMYDWKREEIYDYIKKNSKNDFVYIQFDYKQLGRDEEYFERESRNVGGDRAAIKREILLEWTSATDNSPFNEDVIDRLNQFKKSPLCTVSVKNRWPILIYKDFNPIQDKFFIGVDVAEGMQQENTAITIANASTLEVIGDFKSSKIPIDELVELLKELGANYFPNCIIVVENNSVGRAVNDFLSKSEVRTKLYYETREKKAIFKIDEVGKKRSGHTKMNMYGVHTGPDTRQQMIDLIQILVDLDYDKINSGRIIEDIAGLERTKTGRIEHSATSFDDNLFSYLLIRWVWAYGKNLSKFNILKKNREALSVKDGDEVFDRDTIMANYRVISGLNTKRQPKAFLSTDTILADENKKVLDNYFKEAIARGKEDLSRSLIEMPELDSQVMPNREVNHSGTSNIFCRLLAERNMNNSSLNSQYNNQFSNTGGLFTW